MDILKHISVARGDADPIKTIFPETRLSESMFHFLGFLYNGPGTNLPIVEWHTFR
jgi:hypothetical protein